MTFSEGDTKREVVPGIHRKDAELQDFSQEPILYSKVTMTLMTEWKTLVGGEGAAPKVAMPQSLEERSLA